MFLCFKDEATLHYAKEKIEKRETNENNDCTIVQFINSKITRSDNPNVRKRQQARFERKCKQVFHKSDLTADASLEDKLLASKRKGFLFQQSQNFRKPIMHLKYKKKFQVPLQRYYTFQLPFLESSTLPEVQ
ncbi:uncharacterized protein OCT59_000399 [Rhizophagus irregularis]|uniref:uncharacterized protein n=1 Tax=Rhizophagus irregularis TaxID=588596 RepID=UPI00332DFB00|nr:hypothetical protein OCT59_000399 [Rhizophagus irregularis]